MGIVRLAACALISFSGLRGLAQSSAPEVLALLPISGPDGALVEISGKNLVGVSAVLFGATRAVFESVSPQTVIAIAPHRVSTSIVTVITPRGRGSSPFAFVVSNDPRIPDEVSYKAGYVNPERPPANFGSARLWGIAIADTRVQGHELAQVEVAWTRLSCRVDGKEVVLNDDRGRVSGGLYQRWPWFATDAHDPMPLEFASADQAAPNQAASNHDSLNQAVVLRVGQRADRVWHFWSPSPRAALPAGKLDGCTVRARVRISAGALSQMGMDYWLSPTVPYGSGGNNHEAGASNWYFPSPRWQEATFTDVGGPQF